MFSVSFFLDCLKVACLASAHLNIDWIFLFLFFFYLLFFFMVSCVGTTEDVLYLFVAWTLREATCAKFAYGKGETLKLALHLT